MRAQANDVEEEETLTDLDISCLEVDNVTASYIGEELTHVAALVELPPGLPDTPLDVAPPMAYPPFAIT